VSLENADDDANALLLNVDPVCENSLNLRIGWSDGMGRDRSACRSADGILPDAE
jgi:hypothetical protein